MYIAFLARLLDLSFRHSVPLTPYSPLSTTSSAKAISSFRHSRRACTSTVHRDCHQSAPASNTTVSQSNAFIVVPTKCQSMPNDLYPVSTRRRSISVPRTVQKPRKTSFAAYLKSINDECSLSLPVYCSPSCYAIFHERSRPPRPVERIV